MKDDPGVVVVRRMNRIDRRGAIDELQGEFVAPELVRDDAVATMHYMSAIAARLQGTTEFEATPSMACSFCDWRPHCPEAAELETMAFGDLEVEVEPELLRVGEPF